MLRSRTRTEAVGACYATSTCDGATDYVKWTYDASGNRTAEKRPAGTTTYAYDPTTGLLANSTSPSGAQTSYTYDPFGRLIEDGRTSSRYNGAGQLTRQTTTAGGGAKSVVDYTYDGDGRRILTAPSTVDSSGSSTAGAKTRWQWDPRSYQLDAETNDDGGLLRTYDRGLGLIAATTTSTASTQQQRSYLHTDLQGSVVAVTGPDGALDSTTTYEPYGVVRSSSVADSTAVPVPVGWAGEYGQPDGTTHLRARQYDPRLGRFTAPDPANATSASATGVYADANPMTGADPFGLWTGRQIAGAINGVAGAVAVVATVASFFPQAAPIAGPLAFAAGATSAAASAYLAQDTCGAAGAKGSCGQALQQAAIQTALAAVGGKVATTSMRSSRAAASSGHNIVEGGIRTRAVNFRPSGADPKWGLTSARLNKHMFGSSKYSLSKIDPGGNSEIWRGYMQELASRPVTSTTSNGMLDIIGIFPQSGGSGSFQFGIRLSPRSDGSFDLVTLLTKQ